MTSGTDTPTDSIGLTHNDTLRVEQRDPVFGEPFRVLVKPTVSSDNALGYLCGEMIFDEETGRYKLEGNLDPTLLIEGYTLFPLNSDIRPLLRGIDTSCFNVWGWGPIIDDVPLP